MCDQRDYKQHLISCGWQSNDDCLCALFASLEAQVDMCKSSLCLLEKRVALTVVIIKDREQIPARLHKSQVVQATAGTHRWKLKNKNHLEKGYNNG